jgi:flagellar hook-length control protein FliK
MNRVSASVQPAKDENANQKHPDASPQPILNDSGKGSLAKDAGPDHGTSKHESSTSTSHVGGSDSKETQTSVPSMLSIPDDLTGTQVRSAGATNASGSPEAPLQAPVQLNGSASAQSSKATEGDATGESAHGVAPQSSLQSAKLVERAGKAEMQVGFQAGEFGNVGIRTSMVHNQVTAEISVERGELRNVLTAELPGLEKKLAEHYATANVVLNSDASGGSSSSSSSSRQDYRPAPQTVPGSEVHQSQPETMVGVISAPETRAASALDIHM